MIAALALLAAQAAPAEPIPEIVVIGHLRSVQVMVGQDPEGQWHCSMNKSTGRPRLDHSFCKAVTKCVRKGASDQDAVDSCIRETRGRLVRKVEREMKKSAS
ncbi:MAG: hypothetical protein QNI87_08285 [Erythrobacter sp.]|uniref:hypothetical protein n=1 Tax=Erythrobacter sp. TaxID=1042 RepID=UPI002638AF63|nr:hypothetical protein [Erythrobacter sp.]MDJ0978522.1 hypothetical protein [Erythrobacter sp.]